jgi:organic hydroperoxide reductase OsmC/OhrA
MFIQARVHSRGSEHTAEVSTNSKAKSLNIPAKENGRGSGINGGELLFLALATCYCNDVYREAERSGIRIRSVDVTCEGEFNGIGLPADNVIYQVSVIASGTPEEDVRKLLEHTDRVAEIQNTVRRQTEVLLSNVSVDIVDE